MMDLDIDLVSGPGSTEKSELSSNSQDLREGGWVRGTWGKLIRTPSLKGRRTSRHNFFFFYNK